MDFRYIRFKRLRLANNRFFRYVLVLIDNFSKFGSTIPLKSKNAQTIKDSFGKTLITSERQTKLIFQKLSNNNNIKHYSRKSSWAAVVAERFNRTIRDLLKRPVSEKVDGNWVDILPTITKQFIKRIHSSTKITPIEASSKK